MTTASHVFDIEIELLEDMHTGSGLGTATVDAALARDAHGRIVVNRTHIKGVWKDTALRLMHLRALESAPVIELFGRAGSRDDAGALDCDSWRTGVRPLVWSSTARREGSRTPQDDTLRSAEHIPAGTRLSGQVRIPGVSQPAQQALRTIVEATDRFGAERTRGAGLVRVVSFAPAKPVRRKHMLRVADVATWPARLRLVLRTREAVCVPATGYPGNIIRSFCFVPGRALLGALCQWGIAHNKNVDDLFDRHVAVGDAHPLPFGTDAAAVDAGCVSVLPMPLNLYAERSRQPADSVWPHWCEPGQRLTPLSETAFRDELVQDPGSGDYAAARRPPDNGYLVAFDRSYWSFYQAPLEMQMRNRRGHPLEEVTRGEQDLFTVEHIPAHSLLLCEIEVPDTAALTRFITAFQDVLEGHDLLRVGRGGAPVEIVDASLSKVAPPQRGCTDTLQLTLTSDLVARSGTLNFHRTLTPSLLAELTGVPVQPTEALTVSANHTLRAFNYVSGLPTAPFEVIRRGSVLRLRGGDLDGLRRKLAGMTALGERTWEGCGRFVVDFRPLHKPGEGAKGDDAAHTPRNTVERDETVLAAAARYCKSLQGKKRPSKSQLHQLLDAVFIARTDAALSRALASFEARRERQNAWKTLFPVADPKKGKDKNKEGAATFSSEIAGLNHARRCLFARATVYHLTSGDKK